VTAPLSWRLRNSKGLPGVLALQDVALTMRGGSIHALLGENGAASRR